jgi:hypothetical protein
MLSTVGRFIYTKYWGIYCMLNTVGRFIYTKYWGILYVEHCEKIYLHKILRNSECWSLWENLFTQITEEYFMLSTVGRFIYTKYWGIYCMLNTVGRFIYTKYWGILYVEHCGKIYLHKILRNTVCWTLRRFIYTQYWGILHVEHCGKIYLHKILRNTVCWTLWEDLFTQNTEEYVMLNTVGRCIFTKFWGIFYVEHCGKIYLPKNWGILYVEHCGKIYLHKILRNTLSWTLWEDLFTQNTRDYVMLSTVGKFIYTKYWEILYAEHSGNIDLHTILGITLCWPL